MAPRTGNPIPTVGAVIVAAGASTRMGGMDKIFVPLGDTTVLEHVVEKFEESSRVDSIVLVVAQGQSLWDAARLADANGHWKKLGSIKAGGSRRQDSVALGLSVLPPCDLVIVHDGARPLINSSLINRGIDAALRTGAAIAAVRVKETVKLAESTGKVIKTLDRSNIWISQTPQVFSRALLEKAHAEIEDDVTDDAAMVEKLGVDVTIFEGSYRNIKITTSEDLQLAEILINSGVDHAADQEDPGKNN